MRLVNKEECGIYQQELFDQIHEGSLFVHPTDTIYGWGCDATNSGAVKKLRDIKGCNERPLPIIAPGKDWIKMNCEVSQEHLDMLPGPVTLIVKLKNESAIANNVSKDDTVGVRLPDHWVSEFATQLGKPIITTCVNKKGEEFINSHEKMSTELKLKTAFFMNSGELAGKRSTIINTLQEETTERC